MPLPQCLVHTFFVVPWSRFAAHCQKCGCLFDNSLNYFFAGIADTSVWMNSVMAVTVFADIENLFGHNMSLGVNGAIKPICVSSLLKCKIVCPMELVAEYKKLKIDNRPEILIEVYKYGQLMISFRVSAYIFAKTIGNVSQLLDFRIDFQIGLKIVIVLVWVV